MPQRLPAPLAQSRKLPFPSLGVFFCPSCAHWRLSRPQRSFSSSRTAPGTRPIPTFATRPLLLSRSKSLKRGQVAYISTPTSTTTVNASSGVPTRLRDLYAALENLKAKAPEHVNLSQLNLILRGLESSDGGTTRVAILGFNGVVDRARLLAKLLVVNALQGSGAWEERLAGRSGTPSISSGATLLRYGSGHEADVSTGGSSQLYEEVFVPSKLLQLHNIEILVSALSSDVVVSEPTTDTSHVERPTDAILVPKLEAGKGGQVTMVRYPIHKAVILGRGLEDCIKFGTFVAGEIATDARQKMVTFAAELPGLTEQQMSLDSEVYNVTALDLNGASEALSRFRVARFRDGSEDLTQYEHDWLHSGIPNLHRWLVDGVPAAETAGNPELKPALANLIRHLMDTTSDSLNHAAISTASTKRPSDLHLESVSELEAGLNLWSRKAHTELRDQLDDAFSGKNWNKISWWKLFWRVDDVTMVAEELLERRWLLGAEKSGLWLMGRLEQAGLASAESTLAKPTASVQSDDIKEVTSTVEAGVPSQDMISSPDPKTVSMGEIARARTTLEEDTIPSLQAAAQRLVLETLSTASLTTSLAALLWLSSTFSLVEAGSIAAFGTVWALRRLQKRWEAKRSQWEAEVKEQGRICLRDVEGGVQGLLGRAKGVEVPEGEVWTRRREAREAIGKLREAFEDATR